MTASLSSANDQRLEPIPRVIENAESVQSNVDKKAPFRRAPKAGLIMKLSVRSASAIAALIAIVVVGAIAFSPRANAVTANDVMNRMSRDERYGYISGTIDMAAFNMGQQGNRRRADCVTNWFYRGGGGPDQIAAAMTRYSDRQAIPVIVAVINRACPA